MTHNNPYEAKLVISEMPRTQEAQQELVTWLKKRIKDIESANPHTYASPMTFRLIYSKNQARNRRLARKFTH